MPLISQLEAIAFLDIHLDPLEQIIRGACDDYRGYSEAQKVAHLPVAKAAVVHSHMVDRASRYAAANSQQVRLLEIRGLFVLLIGDRVAIRFKKLDEELRSRNQPTQQVREFRGQMGLPGFPQLFNLEAGYREKPLAGTEQAYLVCPNNDGVYWSVELDSVRTKAVIVDLYDGARPTQSEQGAEFRPKPQPGSVTDGTNEDETQR